MQNSRLSAHFPTCHWWTDTRIPTSNCSIKLLRKLILLPDWGRHSLTEAGWCLLCTITEKAVLTTPGPYSKPSGTLTPLQGWDTLLSLIEGSARCHPLLRLQRALSKGETRDLQAGQQYFQTCRAKLGISSSKTLNWCLKQKNIPLLFENFRTSSQSLHFV